MKLVSKPITNRKNSINHDNKSQYAVKVSGGFHISDPIKTIQIQTAPNIAKYDITDALQISFPANVLNHLLINDTIILSSEIFLKHINKDSILSFGTFENLYSNYKSFINESLGHMFSNTSLFSKDSNNSLNTFNKSDLLNLLNSNTFVEGNIVSSLTGDIQILEVNKTLQNVHKFNIFGNRTTTSYNNEFIPGDFLYMSEGLSITLKTDISVEPMYLSFINSENANRNMSCFNEKLNKTYVGNVMLYLV
jgi:hypothetical protein